MKALQLALSRREKINQLITNLQGLKADGQVEDDQYDQMKTQYGSLLEQAEDNLNQIREALKTERDRVAQDLEACKKEMQNLQLRVKVGEIRPEEATRRLTKAQNRTTALSGRMAQLDGALAAESAMQVGGYVDVDVNKTVKYSGPRAFDLAAGLDKIRKPSVTLPKVASGGMLGVVVSGGGLPARKRVLQQVAGGVFCLVALLGLLQGRAYLNAADLVSGARQLGRVFGFGASLAKEVAGHTSSAMLNFTGFLLIAMTLALGGSAEGLFRNKDWAARLTLITCAAGVLVSILCLFVQGFYVLILLFIPAYAFGAYSVLDT
jgi:uncharacterized membrane protein YjjP (DUF1212 family)